ncbi:MAG: serpin family protein [candidate division WOR-3 bacterium]|nr:serpin family protein [candidate division WOR-3 bacterium]
MTRQVSCLFLVLLLCAGVGSFRCSTRQQGKSQSKQSDTGRLNRAAGESTGASDLKALAQAADGFGFRLFRKEVDAKPGSNVFISPASIAMALTMTCNGAASGTREVMAKVLGLEDMSQDQVNRASAVLRTALVDPDPKVQLAIANSLWGRLVKPGSIWAQWGFKFRPDFLDANRRYFAAKVSMLDFDQPSARDVINKWVSENTRGKIPRIVDTITQEHVLFLVNAVYFKGTWSEKFDSMLTRDKDFHPTRGSVSRVRMMAQDGGYQYYESEDFQAVRLPYGTSRVGMYVFLPDSNSNLQHLYSMLDGSVWKTWLGRFSSRPGHVELPKFRLDYETELSDVLKELGMAVAFDRNQADFSRMVEFGPQAGPDARARIDAVRHKTFVDVNEGGTEAAAVTSVEIGVAGAALEEPPPKPFVMIVDRPFMCAICDDETGAVLFLGSIVNPQ